MPKCNECEYFLEDPKRCGEDGECECEVPLWIEHCDNGSISSRQIKYGNSKRDGYAKYCHCFKPKGDK